jgi:hypothetical protein
MLQLSLHLGGGVVILLARGAGGEARGIFTQTRSYVERYLGRGVARLPISQYPGFKVEGVARIRRIASNAAVTCER